MKFEDIVDNFLAKDSESNIQLVTSVANIDLSGITNSMINEQSLNPAGMKMTTGPSIQVM